MYTSLKTCTNMYTGRSYMHGLGHWVMELARYEPGGWVFPTNFLLNPHPGVSFSRQHVDHGDRKLKKKQSSPRPCPGPV
ncbi:hypothetical protein AAMO2058_001447100 [Amorphochlora amoebiformis]